MLIHRAPPFLLKAWPYIPGKTWGDAYCVPAALPTHTTSLPPHVTVKGGELSSTTDELKLAGHRARVGTQAAIPAGPRVSTPSSPGKLCCPPHCAPHQLHGGKVPLHSFHHSILPAVPAYTSVKLDICNRESCPVAGGVVSLNFFVRYA